ncbi:U3 small nucleolar ribonucleoprotein complex, subunit Mpp10, partial [Obelidium mucronatum]
MLKYLSARASEVISRGDIEPSRDLDREEFEANEEDEEFPDEDEEDALEIDQDNEEDEMELDDANGGFDDLDDDEDDNDEQGDEAEDSNSTSKKDHKLRFNEEVNERTFLKNEPASQFNDEDADEEIPSSDLKTSKDLFDLGDDEEDEDANRELSKFELEQKALADQIETLEAEAVAEKAWTMKGEVSGKVRPMNSLLEEDLEVEHASRPTPVITEETTKSLEDLIKSRIAESLFDDVERKIAPKEKSFDPNRRNIIDEQKSSKSLTDLYEQDYRKQAGATVKTAKDEAVENAHKEIDGLFKDLCMNLDALSNWHFTAKAPVAELEVVAAPSVPALSIEEVIPAVVSDAVLAAPKEVYAGDVGKSQAEMEKADKVKARNKQKRAFKKQRIERELDQKAR